MRTTFEALARGAAGCGWWGEWSIRSRTAISLLCVWRRVFVGEEGRCIAVEILVEGRELGRHSPPANADATEVRSDLRILLSTRLFVGSWTGIVVDLTTPHTT
jgi:hypothetical protein